MQPRDIVDSDQILCLLQEIVRFREISGLMVCLAPKQQGFRTLPWMSIVERRENPQGFTGAFRC